MRYVLAITILTFASGAMSLFAQMSMGGMGSMMSGMGSLMGMGGGGRMMGGMGGGGMMGGRVLSGAQRPRPAGIRHVFPGACFSPPRSASHC